MLSLEMYYIQGKERNYSFGFSLVVMFVRYLVFLQLMGQQTIWLVCVPFSFSMFQYEFIRQC